MANVPSAEKRNRQRLRRRQRSLSHLTRVRTFVKRVRKALEEKDQKAPALLAAAVRAIDKAAQKGVVKRQTASRAVSRLTHAVEKAFPSKAKPTAAQK